MTINLLSWVFTQVLIVLFNNLQFVHPSGYHAKTVEVLHNQLAVDIAPGFEVGL